jgi:hypothetical protein
VSKSIGGGKPGRAATALAYAERLGRHFSNIVEWISWPDTELRQLLKARKRTIAIQDWQTSCDWRRRILIAWVTPYIRRCQAAHARTSPSAGGTAVIVLRIALGTGGQDRGQTAYSHGLKAGSKLGLGIQLAQLAAEEARAPSIFSLQITVQFWTAPAGIGQW